MMSLRVETSCDETAVALVKDGRLVHSLTSSQAELHSLFGGVVPELASREHYRFIGPLFDKLLVDSGASATDIDAIAVTRGPGLLGSLLVGVAFAKSLALALGRPLIGANHLRAHLLAVGLSRPLVFPALGVLASGGHTHLYWIKSHDDFEILGTTIDDAAGEAFDKIGQFLNLPYPGGPVIDLMAIDGEPSYELPRPYIDNDNLDFSFSGLKTAAIRVAREHRDKDFDIRDFCASLNEAIADTLVVKTERALEKFPAAAIWFAGGVAANSLARKKLEDLALRRGLAFLVPEKKFCGDNAAMIAYNGWLLAQEGKTSELDLESIPRGRKIPDDYRKAIDLDSEAP
ncbi:MAG: tRNA (adenosine(37)-N6)-threonylcarbamoyltransferase complex transferase subunit TsaD [Desulfovibrio sp.]|nr:tRNA (adenosine(37)-N6)-threonylcarbamoyltransferase complex transferase subunit TsaD [Desulfovibrio sp.]